ncbi:uncharacterized protein LOC126750338 isoform X1 [Anthonomus grandis grandis]|uniref:uncharacterized protein LOC126750338 isoform X1 n=1 Tax=Anthonomus grandis grandis TaxID=2921223 RepID=UPI0021667AB2|nr:uncharacterized protein LOC126750338 isoform X1 [Anthonomus grandis grandis]
MRAALPARSKLQITLRYLASGCCFRTLECLYRVPKSSISKFLPAVLEAIYESLEMYIQVPKTNAEWNIIARGFEERWNFQGCCGAIDGKHVNIQQPQGSGSDFYNYKGFFSTVPMALVDSDYSFIFIDVGSQGRMNNSTIFNHIYIKSLHRG